MILFRTGAMALLLSHGALPAAHAQQGPAEDTRPLSAAQTALFETPHLRNVTRVGTLGYGLVREGPVAFSDKITVHVRKVNPDGTKNLSFEYLTGDRQVRFPELDNFRGNPLLILMLDRDVIEMKEQVGLSTTYFRNKIREAFVTGAAITDTTFMLAGTAVPSREITVRPFEGDKRLDRIPSLQSKSYTFVLADAVPGTIAEIRTAVPADAAMATPAFSQRITFVGVEP
ncbi:MAG: hypothetical protein H7Z10_11330 [Gemmatimonadaceae bacterium]|nr:hypothetical protein [Acetobacteraceae bacterium]